MHQSSSTAEIEQNEETSKHRSLNQSKESAIRGEMINIIKKNTNTISSNG